MAFSGRPSFRPREFKGPCGRINILNDEVDADSLSPTLTAVSPRIPLPPFIVPSSHQSSRLQYPPGLGRPIRQSPVHPTNAQPNIQTLLPSPVLSTKESRGDSDSRASSLEASEASSSSWHRNKRTPFKCSWEGCDKVFRESYNLKSHFFLHANVRPFKCQYCEASFVRHRDLLRHESSVHETRSKDHQCHSCGFLFARKDSLRRHAKKCD